MPAQPGTPCSVCGKVEEPGQVTDNMASFAPTTRTLHCVAEVGVKDPQEGIEYSFCRQHQVPLEQALTREFRAANPYVQMNTHTTARMVTWLGDPFLPAAKVGPEFKLFGYIPARYVTVEFEGMTLRGVWTFRHKEFVNLRAIAAPSHGRL